MFDTAQGVTLKANNREATFTLSEDHLFALNLNNKLMPAPKPNAEHTGEAVVLRPEPSKRAKRTTVIRRWSGCCLQSAAPACIEPDVALVSSLML